MEGKSLIIFVFGSFKFRNCLKLDEEDGIKLTQSLEVPMMDFNTQIIQKKFQRIEYDTLLPDLMQRNSVTALQNYIETSVFRPRRHGELTVKPYKEDQQLPYIFGKPIDFNGVWKNNARSSFII